jgi:hypothetical protein
MQGFFVSVHHLMEGLKPLFDEAADDSTMPGKMVLTSDESISRVILKIFSKLLF